VGRDKSKHRWDAVRRFDSKLEIRYISVDLQYSGNRSSFVTLAANESERSQMRDRRPAIRVTLSESYQVANQPRQPPDKSSCSESLDAGSKQIALHKLQTPHYTLACNPIESFPVRWRR